MGIPVGGKLGQDSHIKPCQEVLRHAMYPHGQLLENKVICRDTEPRDKSNAKRLD